MYLIQQFKFRYGEFYDLFYGDMISGKGIQYLKENVLYFLYHEHKILGPYKTYFDNTCLSAFTEMYLNVLENKVLVIEPRQVAQQVAIEEMYLRTATVDDMERNTLYYEYVNKNLMGPYMMVTDISAYDTNLLRKIENGIIFIVNEKQSFSR